MDDLQGLVENAATAARELLKEKGLDPPEVGLVLGSGLGELVAGIQEAVELPAQNLPGLPRGRVAGHAGRLVFGRLEGLPVAALQGRAHVYEGLTAARASLPVRVMARLGIRVLLLTNAAGGVEPGLRPGTLMLISDHLNLQGESPLEGANVEAWGPRFPDMSTVYPEWLRLLARQAAEAAGIALHEGVYACMRGPQYETPAEVRMLALLGADAVGMSTVPEAVVAAHMGVEVLGVSLIANPAAGLSPTPLSHQEVLEAGRRASGDLEALVRGVVARLPAGEVRP